MKIIKLSVKILVFLAVIFGGLAYSGAIARAACQLDDTYRQVSLNKTGVAPSFAAYATGESVTATVNTKQGFSCEGYQVQFMLCPVPGSSGADCSVGKTIGTIPVANGSAIATWAATQFNSFSNFRVKAAAGTDNPNAGSNWQYYTDQFSVLSGSQCGITNFTALQSGNNINFDVTTTSPCEDKAVKIELLIQSSNLGTTSGGTVSSGTIKNGKFSGSWPLDTSLGIVYFKACITGVDACQTSTTSGTSPGGGGGGGGGCGTPGQPACPAGQTKTYFFSIPNPLKGGASDLASLVTVIAQWIFNLAIPIAVAMIVYAGVLFLTAQGSEQKVTKAKDVLKWAVVGLAIILIGSGFITLIQSILELGTVPGVPAPIESDYGPPTLGAIGNKCSSDRDCLSVFKCKNAICQRPTGNFVGEWCNGGTNCDVGLACDQTSDVSRVIDGQTLGKCFQTSVIGGRIGDVCQKNSDCISGLKCNQICQRANGNLNGEACLRTSDPSNCQSRACLTSGADRGVCTEYSGT